MGQHEDYLYVDNWDKSLSRKDRIERGPFQSFFGVGRGERAAAAVASARQRSELADQVLAQVKEQAVYALLVEGLSVRAIADRTGIPKTDVGRISRRLGNIGTGQGSGSTTMPLVDPDQNKIIGDQIREAWGEPT
ncbi:hypothetical protein ACIQXM_18015 [Arthrobacter sp. NPDC097144]|uniref:hypothetical protein n=1 Tax=Arthrobacter sp. NPDC097144 TaxID=3363946 RepID=UPI00380A8307